MALKTDEEQAQYESRFGRSVALGILYATPIALVLVTIAVLLMTGRTLSSSIAIAVLPGVLIGVFFGGFVGMVRALED